MTARAQNFAFAFAMTVVVGGSVALQIVRDARMPIVPVDRLLYITSGDVMKKVALSYDALLADVYWIRAIQHYGGDRMSNIEKRYELLYPLLDLTTSLDPRFMMAYRFGAIFLMEPYPGGAGRPDLAIGLLEKGITHTPDKWQYYLDIGFVYYWRLSDYRHAAEWFRRGGDLPDGPWWLRSYAAVMLAKGGDRQSSRFLWLNLYQTSQDDWIRNTAQLRLRQLDALDQIDQLYRIVGEYRQRAGRLPQTWTDVVAARLLRGVPLDPSGIPYLLDTLTGNVTVSSRSRLYPLPVEPTANAAQTPDAKAPSGS
jgi:hypothetical protein